MESVPVSFPNHAMATTTMERGTSDRARTDAPGKRPKNRGNFANDPARAREAGRKGGKARGKREMRR